MTDFNLPTNTTLVSEILEILRDRDASVAKMDFASDSNLATGFLRLNRSNRVFEEWNGSAWVEKRLEQPGIVKPYAGTAAPRGHLLCDGAAVSRTTYADLFAVVGTTYGAGDGINTFNVPNLTGRFPLGKTASGTGSSLGGTGGALGHTHGLPAHYHGMGAGADLNITSSGTHTTTIDISHGHTHSMDTSATGILAKVGQDENVSGYANVYLTDAGHAHSIEGHGTTTAGDGKNTGNSTTKFAKARTTAVSGTGDTNGATASTDSNITLVNGYHRHAVTLSDPKHNHPLTINALTATSKSDSGSEIGKHIHGAGNFGGRVGLVSGGVDGNAEMTSGAGDPPFIALNYIISI